MGNSPARLAKKKKSSAFLLAYLRWSAVFTDRRHGPATRRSVCSDLHGMKKIKFKLDPRQSEAANSELTHAKVNF